MNSFCFSIGKFLLRIEKLFFVSLGASRIDINAYLCKDVPSENKTVPFLDELINISSSCVKESIKTYYPMKLTNVDITVGNRFASLICKPPTGMTLSNNGPKLSIIGFELISARVARFSSFSIGGRSAPKYFGMI